LLAVDSKFGRCPPGPPGTPPRTPPNPALVEIDLVADPERLRQLDLVVLDD
jgi:hypothetical protein